VGSDGLIQRENTTGLRGITRIDTTDGGRLFGHLTGAEVSELEPDASLIRFAGEEPVRACGVTVGRPRMPLSGGYRM